MNFQSIGLHIRNRRRALQVTQSDLARISGISVHALSNIESGKGNPTLKTLQDILGTLGMKLDVVIRKPGDTDA